VAGTVIEARPSDTTPFKVGLNAASSVQLLRLTVPSVTLREPLIVEDCSVRPPPPSTVISLSTVAGS
jgi:hypothetical protein